MFTKTINPKVTFIFTGFILLNLLLWLVFQSQSLPDKGRMLFPGMGRRSVKFILGGPVFESDHMMFWSGEQGKLIQDLSDVNMTQGFILFFKDGELVKPRLFKTTQVGVWEAYCIVFDVSLKDSEIALGERSEMFNE